MTLEEADKEYNELMASLDEVERMILRAAILGRGRGVLTLDRLKTEVPDMLDRHRAGKPVCIEEIQALYIAPAAPTEVMLKGGAL